MTAFAETAEPPVLVEKRGGIALVTLNRPTVLNALNADLLGHLETALLALRDDVSVMGLILTGAGERSFVAGADIGELAASDAATARAGSARGQSIFGLLETMGKPSIAAVNGYALGGGCELALACTIRLAAAHASFGLPEVKLGLFPGYGGTQRLPRVVGKAIALQMLLTGDPIDATEALRVGLVSEVLALEALMPRAQALMSRMTANAPLAVRGAIQAVNHGLDAGPAAGLALENALFGLCAGTQDKQEGTAAFLEKRHAHFIGQ